MRQIHVAILERAAENAYQNRDMLLANALYTEVGKVAAEDPFERAVKNKTFRHPETGNKVKFHSLPSDEQSKIREQWSKKKKPSAPKPAGSSGSTSTVPRDLASDLLNKTISELWQHVENKTGPYGQRQLEDATREIAADFPKLLEGDDATIKSSLDQMSHKYEQAIERAFDSGITDNMDRLEIKNELIQKLRKHF